MDKWKSVVKDERKAAHGLGAQRALPNTVMQTPHPSNRTAHQTLNGHMQTASRSASTASAFSAAEPTRTDSMNSEERDADGEEDAEADAEADEDDSATETEMNSHRGIQHSRTSSAQNPRLQQHSRPGQAMHQGNGPPGYGWHPQEMSTGPSRVYPPNISRMPPGPDDWKREMAVAMEGVEGPATGA
jgi:hypothetical protein